MQPLGCVLQLGCLAALCYVHALSCSCRILAVLSAAAVLSAQRRLSSSRCLGVGVIHCRFSQITTSHGPCLQEILLTEFRKIIEKEVGPLKPMFGACCAFNFMSC